MEIFLIFIIVYRGRVRMFDLKHRSTTSRFYKQCAVKSLRLPRSRALARARESVRLIFIIVYQGRMRNPQRKNIINLQII